MDHQEHGADYREPPSPHHPSDPNEASGNDAQLHRLLDEAWQKKAEARRAVALLNA